MKIEHYSCTRKAPNNGVNWWRWRIIDEETKEVIVQGNRFYKTRIEAQRDIEEVLEFLEAWCREKTMHGSAVWGL